MGIDGLIKALNEFEPFSENLSIATDEEFLSNLLDKYEGHLNFDQAIPAIFNLIERFPESDFGSPGPLVHALEARGVDNYEGHLFKSLMKKPTSLTIWMYNRIINSVKYRQILIAHIERLKLFYRHPLIGAKAKEATARFIDFQESRLKSI